MSAQSWQNMQPSAHLYVFAQALRIMVLNPNTKFWLLQLKIGTTVTLDLENVQTDFGFCNAHFRFRVKSPYRVQDRRTDRQTDSWRKTRIRLIEQPHEICWPSVDISCRSQLPIWKAETEKTNTERRNAELNWNDITSYFGSVTSLCACLNRLLCFEKSLQQFWVFVLFCFQVRCPYVHAGRPTDGRTHG